MRILTDKDYDKLTKAISDGLSKKADLIKGTIPSNQLNIKPAPLYAPLTNGDPLNPELMFLNGDIIMVEHNE